MPQATLKEYFKNRIPKAIPSSNFTDLQSTSSARNENALASGTIDQEIQEGTDEDDASAIEKLIREISNEDSKIEQAVGHIPKASISTVTDSHLPAIKQLTSVTLPVRYPDKFFLESVHDPDLSALARVVLYEEKPVGWIRCRLEVVPQITNLNDTARPDMHQVYVQALCLLAPYRGHGLATILLETILQSDAVAQHNVGSIYAHVWEQNEGALEWYEKRGFRRVILVDHYYRKLKPAGAWVVRKDLQ